MPETNTLNKLVEAKLGQTDYSRVWDKDKAYSILVPDDWAVGSTEKFERVFVGPEEAGLQMNVGIAQTEIVRGNKRTLQLLGVQLTDFLQNNYSDLEFIENQELDLDENKPAILWVFNWTDLEDKTEITQAMLMVANGSTLYNLTATMAKAAYTRYWPIFKNMFYSIRFEPGE